MQCRRIYKTAFPIVLLLFAAIWVITGCENRGLPTEPDEQIQESNDQVVRQYHHSGIADPVPVDDVSGGGGRPHTPPDPPDPIDPDDPDADAPTCPDPADEDEDEDKD